MKLSKKGFDWVYNNEGLHLDWYKDPVGVPTIGYGATMLSKVFKMWWRSNRRGVPFKKGVSITKSEAVEISRLMFADEYGAAVNRHLDGKKVPQHVFDAMASAALNMGIGSLKWRWGMAAKRGDYKEAARLIQTVGLTGRNPKTGERRRLKGLVRRRREEANVLQFGKYPEIVKSSPKPKSLRRGDKGDAVSKLIKKLSYHGYYSGPHDGVFGGGVEAGVMHFQDDASLKIDGIAGSSTMAALSRWSRRATPRRQTSRAGFVYKNQWAIRNLHIEESLISNVLKGVEVCYGPNCRVECYSGGQPRKGTAGRRTGSIRHDIRKTTGLGRAGDFHIFKPNGIQIVGVELAKLGQWWLSKGFGSVGLEMSGGGIHIDNWITPPAGGSNFWTYKASDKMAYGFTIRQALEKGHSGKAPVGVYVPPPIKLPDPVQAVVDDADKEGVASSTNKAVGVGGVATSILAAKPVIDAVNDAKDGVSSLLQAGPLVIAVLVIAGVGVYIWRERNRKAKLAQAAKAETA